MDLEASLSSVAYDLLGTAVFILASPAVAWKYFLDPGEWSLRLGATPQSMVWSERRGTLIWLHAASVGEVAAIAPLAEEVSRVRPDASLLVTTTTSSGRQRARELIPFAAWHLLVPIDVRWIVRHAMERWRPSALLIAETELWPHLVAEAKRVGARVSLVNGRISEPSFGLYRRVPGLTRSLFGKFDLLAVQTPVDAHRVTSLGADPSRVVVTASLKYDLGDVAANGRLSRSTLGVPEKALVVVAGSTRDGEEELVLEAIDRISEEVGGCYLVLAPRHRKRFGEVARLLRRRSVTYRRRSLGGGYEGERVLLLDTIGELSRVYGVADVAFVGGSLLPFGGHNPLEPAYHSVPVLFGPHMTNSSESAERLQQGGGGVKVSGPDELARTFRRLLVDEEERQRRGSAARLVVENESGVARRVVALLRERGII